MGKISVIGVPSSAGARRTGQELAPQSFRRAGLLEKLRLSGMEVNDFGDLPELTYRPDPQHPKAQNLGLVVGISQRIATQVETAVSDEAIPLVLGGDCTITLGILAGLIKGSPNLGLMYFDGDVDLNTPETTTSGILDGMVIAHMTGKGAATLARLGPRYPLMAEGDIALFGYNPDAGSIDAAEAEVLRQSRMMKYPASEIRGIARQSATDALSQLENRVDSVLVHLDVDVIDFDDFPAGDVPHSHGLSFADAMSALEVFVVSRKLAGLVITEFNAHRDPEGVLASRLVESVTKALQMRL